MREGARAVRHQGQLVGQSRRRHQQVIGIHLVAGLAHIARHRRRLLGLGIPYSQAKREHMSADTVEGAQLALDLGPTLVRMGQSGAIDRNRLPLAFAIVDTVCNDAPLELRYDLFHRSAE